MPSMPIIANWDEYSAEWLLAESLATPKPAPKPEPAPLWASPAMFAYARMIGMGYEDFTMAEIAVNSDQPQDRWQLHATAVREAYYTSLETLDAAREYAQESTSEAQPLEWIDGTEARVDDTHKWVIREED